MDEILLSILCLALLLAAAGMLLWQWARGRQERQAVQRHLAQQLEAKAVAVAVEASLSASPRTSFIDAPGNGMAADPWINADGEPPVVPNRKARLQALLPSWLEGAVSVQLIALAAVLILALSTVAGSLAGWISAVGTFVVLLALSVFGLWLRLQKFRRHLVSQLPTFIDAMVRLITIGNSTQAAFQLAIPSTQAPLQHYLERAANLVRAGVDLDRALHQTAASVRVEEMYLLASILGLGVRYGGRADLLLERVANFMRDREQAQHELVAMSAETRLSAWILGLLPLGVGGFIIISNPGYFLRMWHDPTGQMMIFGAVGLQLLGTVLLYRLARLT
ncbi:tight adherence protein B [Variovorax sp. OK605]|uniref:type II secretion system F family protein n=1 Tax=unclassified Variovorax TaxID=663243 RepID=UPI0008C1A84E|nr:MULTISPECIES: type II secretion system F family protein [unclassified Variovorax]SEK11095.1 tight adherence protein B [Variovorax sp. OK202]SFD72455.1 tight adherence protein B [Variovorax sp. OK212]SFP95337.1 tight adherence protein B [Variovorax sp. OK605]